MTRPLPDWDFRVTTTEFEAVQDALPSLVSPRFRRVFGVESSWGGPVVS